MKGCKPAFVKENRDVKGALILMLGTAAASALMTLVLIKSPMFTMVATMLRVQPGVKLSTRPHAGSARSPSLLFAAFC